MSFVSYAQNLEDVMLWRALKHVQNGFYIDVGANDPDIDSVTKAFYERDWNGINVEPLPSHHADLVRARARDINLLCAAAAMHGQIELWECNVRGWATASPTVASRHMENGHKGTYHKVNTLSLREICTQYVTRDIHFLKIDVEGFEKDVIDGMDFKRFRPWILVIEATRPNSTEEIHWEWEPALLAANYLLAYTDGLNRFYVAQEKPELLSALRYPPNVFDEFIRSEQLNSELRAQQAEAKAQQAEAKAQQAEAASNQHLMQLHAVYNSKSWRITTPLREANKALRSIIGMALQLSFSKSKDLARRVPAFRRVALWVLRRFPVFERLVSRFSATPFSAARVQQPQIRHFEQLRSVRIMRALSQLPANSSDGPVSFLNVSNDVS